MKNNKTAAEWSTVLVPLHGPDEQVRSVLVDYLARHGATMNELIAELDMPADEVRARVAALVEAGAIRQVFSVSWPL